MKWTDQQQEAISSKGQDILVAAAAGSGKTAVLVERIIQKLLSKEDPVDIDSLLVVTFTNAAAQEMRNRIGEALEKALAEYPESNHLKKQLSLLQRASISTLHSFCMDIVRQYAYLLDIDPSFRIGNPLEIDLMKQDVIDELFEEWYGGKSEESEAFISVVERFSSDRSDVEVEALILDLYDFSRQHPWPNVWLDRLAENYEIPGDWQEEDLEWLSLLKRYVLYHFQGFLQEANRALNLSRLSDGPYHYIDTIEADIKLFEGALEKINHWEELQSYVEESSFKRLSGKKFEGNEDLRDEVKEIRDQYRRRWNDMKDRYFVRDLPSHIADMKEMYPVIKALTTLVKKFSLRFMKHKQAAGVLDFLDLEHYSLQLLIDKNSSYADPKPSEVAKQFKEQFTEVLVDEYQDINLVQETILTMLSNEGEAGNRFMVGDVKQSIYGFRHAEPSLFIEKYNRFVERDSPAKRIDLASNFRSREAVLAGANYIFRQIFDENIGEIKYDDSAELIYANKMYNEMTLSKDDIELILIDREPLDPEKKMETEEDYTHLANAELEARMYAKKIKQWIGQEGEPLQIIDQQTGKQRSMQYRDVVILLRSMTHAPVIVEELKRQGIPVYAELATGYFEAVEIKVLLNLLKIIDNPRQDIPLASVLKSPIVGLDEEQLAKIRLANPNSLYFDALKTFVQEEGKEDKEAKEKVKQFLKQLERFQFIARQGALSELIWEIYRQTGYYDFVGGIPGGRQRQANLRALYDRARSFESTSFRGLFRFLRFIERMQERGDDLGAARALSELEDVVRITTIHKSKGLEYPVVIIGGIAHEFNLMDLRNRYLLHKDYGMASRYINPEKHIMYPTLFYRALHSEMLREQLSEEMRVLYVALTRAKEKLVMIGQVSSAENTISKWQSLLSHEDWVLPIHLRLNAKSYLDWIGPALIRHRDADMLRKEKASLPKEIFLDKSKWKFTILHASELIDSIGDQPVETIDLKDHITHWKPLSLEDNSLKKKVDARLSYKYPYEQAVEARVKQSVTEIKRMYDEIDPYSSDEILRKKNMPIAKRPAFMQQEKTLTKAEIGTAMHTVMQHIPFTHSLSKQEIRDFVQRLIEQELLTKDEAKEIDIDVIVNFFKTDIAQRMIKTENLYREVPFSLTLPAKEVYPTWDASHEERVLIQGVIDCLISTGDGLIILDYKTDAIPEKLTEEVKKELKVRYEVQMKLYKQAVETILDKKVLKTYVYYFDKQLLLEI